MLDAKPTEPARVTPLKEEIVARVRRQLWMLFGAVGLVLLIACANVAALLLARANSRSREFAIRAAVGAARTRLVAQLLTESILLALLGASCGLLLARWCVRSIAGLTSVDLPRSGDIVLDGPVLAFSIALSLLTGILLGLMPALNASRPDVAGVLRGTSGTRQRKALVWNARGLLVILQVALSMVLLIGASLLMQSIVQLGGVNPGFDAAHLLTMQISLPPERYDTNQKKAAFFDQLVAKTETVPGVESAAVAFTLPMTGFPGSPLQVAEQPLVQFNRRPIVAVEIVTSAYFRTLRIPLRRGREFDQRDNAQAQPVAIINEKLARRFWPAYPAGPSPIGQHVFIGSAARPAQIVGIVADLRQAGLDQEAWPAVFSPNDQEAQQAAMLAVRTKGDPMTFAGAVRNALRSVDSDQGASAVQTMDDIVEAVDGQRRFLTKLLCTFAAAAVLLAIIGLYGVIAYTVIERNKEIGIRRALGAQRSDILALVINQGLALTLVGVVFGAAAAYALTRVMQSLLFQVSATDPITFGGVALMFVVVALGASYFPARRATRVDPAEVLRIG